MELLGHTVILVLLFWETSILFSIVATPIYLPTNSVQRFPFFQIFSNIFFLWSFWWQPFWQLWGNISLWLWFSLSWFGLISLGILSTFSHIVGHMHIFYEQMSVQMPKFLIRFLDFVGIPAIVWILALYEASGLQIFSPIL